MVYRPDIDGLRGVAVLLVVLFHSGLSLFPGGFIGVDVFFVISGYLITSIILDDVRRDRFSYIGFYERRIRRILPALYVMILLVMLLALFVQMPIDLIKSAKTVFFATLFSSNIYFWRTTDYFSNDSDFEYFLHTWSLGVEEQFYFIFPLVILLFVRRGQWLLILTLLALVLSFCLSVYATYYYQWASYYLLPSRAWQMMMGAVLAIAVIRWTPSKAVVSLLGVVALACIFIPALLYSKQTRFPGVAALLPTFGAALLIFLGGVATSHQWLSRIMGAKWLVGIGLISYSLYLWHWPVFAFLRNYHASVRLETISSILGIAVSFLLAYLSWRFIEAPFRSRQKFSRRSIYAMAGTVSLSILAICIGLLVYKGVPSRIHPDVLRLSQVSESAVIGDPCLNKTSAQLSGGDLCFVGRQQSPVSIVLWGDSHLGALKHSLDAAFKTEGKKAAFFGKIGCPPLQAVLKKGLGDGEQCMAVNREAVRYIEQQSTVTTVVLHARWALSVEGTRYAPERGARYILEDVAGQEQKVGEFGSGNAGVVAGALNRMVQQFLVAGKRVVIISSVPEVGFGVPKVEANSLFWGKDRDIRPPLSRFMSRQAVTHGIFSQLQEKYPALVVVDPADMLCDDAFCHVMRDGNPLYFDDDHVSDTGAKLIVRQLLDVL